MTDPTDRVEIITSVQRRRRWTASEKVRIVEETFEPGMRVSLVARRHGVAPPAGGPAGAWVLAPFELFGIFLRPIDSFWPTKLST